MVKADADLAQMSKLHKKFLARRCCALCGQWLDRSSCGSIFFPKCSEATRTQRRADCLATYKPRKVRKHG